MSMSLSKCFLSPLGKQDFLLSCVYNVPPHLKQHGSEKNLYKIIDFTTVSSSGQTDFKAGNVNVHLSTLK